MTEKCDKIKPNQMKNMPKDAHVIIAMMKEIGITDYEPRVINQLLDFTYKYSTNVLDDAKTFAKHANKNAIEADDVRLAVHMQVDKTFTSPPSKEVLMEVARSKNVIPLPNIKPHCGLRLPPDRYTLAACNYKLKVAAKRPPKQVLQTTPTVKTVTKPTQQNVVIRKPQSSGPSVKSQPVLKFTSNTKIVTKPAVRVTSGGATVKMEIDPLEINPNKRKRED